MNKIQMYIYYSKAGVVMVIHTGKEMNKNQHF